MAGHGLLREGVSGHPGEIRNTKQMRMLEIRICQTELRSTPDGIW